MDPIFSVGDKVKCIIGGPAMVINSVITHIVNGHTKHTYVCMYWNLNTALFTQWNIGEGALIKFNE